jgi:hypothetical protein
VTELDYWRDYKLTRDAVAAAIESFHGYLAINNFAVADKELFRKINEVPEFWRLHAFSLQTTFFIVLARIFDISPDAHSVHKLLAATVQHPEFFSKAALCARKREVSKVTGANPKWLDEYLKNITWEASTADLRTLKRALRPHASKFESVYRPIRTNVFAHQLLKDQALISDLFSKTLIKEMDDILHFLHDLIGALWELAYNGMKPALGVINYGYQRRIEEIKANTRKLLDQLS